MRAVSQSPPGAAPGQLERELAYYRRECNDLGARLLRLQEEQGQALREARRSRMVAKLVREAHHLADADISPDELGGPMLEIIVENALCDRAAFLAEQPQGSGRFTVTHSIGRTEPDKGVVELVAPPPFLFTTALSHANPPADHLTRMLGVPHILWWYDRSTGHALIVGNHSQTNVSPPFQPGDQEIVEGGLSVYLDVLARKQAEVQLRLAMRAAEEAGEAKAAFLATLSHELRTPLDSILGYSELMSGKEAGLTLEKCAAYAAQIHDSGYHLLRLIDDILDYSSIARGPLPLQCEWVRLAQLVQGAARAASPVADRRGVALEVAPVDPRTGVHVDPRRFRQILDNVVNNAIKFTHAGGSVRVSLKHDPAGSLGLVVRDTGVGMRPEDIPRALEPFRQLDNPLTRSAPGAGLGLPITRGLIEAHGGTLAIASACGQGTVVTVTLPPSRVALDGNAPSPVEGTAA